MIIEHSTVFGNILWTAESLNGVLFHWNRKKHRLSLHKTKKAYYSLLKLFLIQGIILAVLIIQGHPKFQSTHLQETFDFTDYFLYSICVLCNISNYCTALALFKYRECICHYINGLAQFHSIYSKHSNSSKGKNVSQKLTLQNMLFWGAIFGLFFTCYLLPVAYAYPLHWMNPCKPSLSGYWLLPECHKFEGSLFKYSENVSSQLFEQIFGILLKIIIMMINHWLWAFGCNAAILAIGGMMLMCTMTMVECIDR